MTPKFVTITMPMGPRQVYRVIQYPAGELQVRIMDEEIIRQIGDGAIVRLVARGATPHDTMTLLLLIDAIKGISSTARIHLQLPYLPYGRADRRFQAGDCWGSRTFALLLGRSGAVETITTIDRHSNNSLHCGNTVEIRNLSAAPFIIDSIAHFAAKTDCIPLLIFPDEGARIRYTADEALSSFIYAIGCKVSHCVKARHPTSGDIIKHEFSEPGLFDKAHPALVIDDICDGGATFIQLEQHIPWGRGIVPLGLYVTHGIFSRGFESLNVGYSHIYTTDSFLSEANRETANYMLYKSTENLLLQDFLSLIKE